MRKGNNVIRNLLSFITIILITILGLSQLNISKANTDEGHEDTYSPTGDRTFVRLVHRDNNKVDVYLEMADSTLIEGSEEAKPGASVTSFQIGLDISVDLEDKGSLINFEFDSSLQNKEHDLMKTTKDFKTEQTPDGEKVMGEALYIFYVGKTELNDSQNKDGIKVGTLSFDGLKHTETVTIEPNKEFTKLESKGYGNTEINIMSEDTLREILINKPNEEDSDDDNGDENDDGTSNGAEENSTTGDGQEDNKSGETEGGDTITTESNKNKQKPSTGDIAIGLFVALMVVSLIALIILTKKKKSISKHSK